MPYTSIADVIVPEVFLEYFREKSVYKNALVQSGLATTDSRFNGLLEGGASTFNVPFWKTNTVVDAGTTPVVEGTTLTPAIIDADKMVARRLFNERAWGNNDVAGVLAGDSPSQAIADSLLDFWNRENNQRLFSIVRGVILDNIANFSGDLVNDITGSPDPFIGSDAVIDTIYKFGDNADNMAAIAMHSVPYANLNKLNIIDFEPTNTQNIGWGTYLGKTVIVDDNLIDGSNQYWTIIFSNGGVGYGEDMRSISEGGLYNPFETDRNVLASGGQDILVARKVHLMHPYGFSWQETAVAGDFPTNAELADPANWSRVFEGPKNCGFSVLLSTEVTP